MHTDQSSQGHSQNAEGQVDSSQQTSEELMTEALRNQVAAFSLEDVRADAPYAAEAFSKIKEAISKHNEAQAKLNSVRSPKVLMELRNPQGLAGPIIITYSVLAEQVCFYRAVLLHSLLSAEGQRALEPRSPNMYGQMQMVNMQQPNFSEYRYPLQFLDTTFKTVAESQMQEILQAKFPGGKHKGIRLNMTDTGVNYDTTTTMIERSQVFVQDIFAYSRVLFIKRANRSSTHFRMSQLHGNNLVLSAQLSVDTLGDHRNTSDDIPSPPTSHVLHLTTRNQMMAYQQPQERGSLHHANTEKSLGSTGLTLDYIYNAAFQPTLAMSDPMRHRPFIPRIKMIDPGANVFSDNVNFGPEMTMMVITAASTLMNNDRHWHALIRENATELTTSYDPLNPNAPRGSAPKMKVSRSVDGSMANDGCLTQRAFADGYLCAVPLLSVSIALPSQNWMADKFIFEIAMRGELDNDISEKANKDLIRHLNTLTDDHFEPCFEAAKARHRANGNPAVSDYLFNNGHLIPDGYINMPQGRCSWATMDLPYILEKLHDSNPYALAQHQNAHTSTGTNMPAISSYIDLIASSFGQEHVEFAPWVMRFEADVNPAMVEALSAAVDKTGVKFAHSGLQPSANAMASQMPISTVQPIIAPSAMDYGNQFVAAYAGVGYN